MKKDYEKLTILSCKNLSEGKFFSPRALFDRFKHILPLSLSKQSLNDTNTNNNGNYMTNLFHSEEFQTFYNYIIHILPDQEIGYFSNGTGCISSSLNVNLNHSNTIRFKYPFDAQRRFNIKIFLFS